MMNLLAIVGSPRKGKATDTLVDKAIEGVESRCPEVGQEFMTAFELIEFDTDRHLTLRMKREAPGHKLFGDVLLSYLIQP